MVIKQSLRKNFKIGLVVDVNNWAFANIATQIMQNLGYKYEFKYVVGVDLQNIVHVFWLVKDCDLVHFFWRGDLLLLKGNSVDQYFKTLGCNNGTDSLLKILKKMKISVVVCDHLYLDSDLGQTKEIFTYVDYYYVSSNKLKKIYDKIEGIRKPDTVITDGVDLVKFYRQDVGRFYKIAQKKKKSIVIGWAGNSKWNFETEDFKGVNTLLIPAIQELKAEGYNLEMFFADRTVRMIPHDKMNDYYSQIDLYICTSKIEGTPNPVLEAMACGVPVISTDVGVVNDVFGDKQKDMILKNRTIQDLKKKILLLINNPELFQYLSDENLKSILPWSWEEKLKDFDKYFSKCLN